MDWFIWIYFSVHSGSPFRLLLEDPEFQNRQGRFVEFAAQGSQCSAVHVDYVLSRNRISPLLDPNASTIKTSTEIVWLRQLRPTNAKSENLTLTSSEFKCTALKNSQAHHQVFVSFDLDAVCGADAPVWIPARIFLFDDVLVKLLHWNLELTSGF
jgi:formiminoglutamase